MSTIVVYKRDPSNLNNPSAAERQEGMKEAGQKLKKELSDPSGSSNDTDAEDRVVSVLEFLITENVGGTNVYDVRFEIKDGANTISYRIALPVNGHGPYFLTHLGPPADATKNGKLRLDIGLDDLAKKKNIFKMRMTVPRAAAVSTSWGYLSTDVNEDLNVIEQNGPAPMKVQNYLISTFMFSRCR